MPFIIGKDDIKRKTGVLGELVEGVVEILGSGRGRGHIMTTPPASTPS